MSEKDYHTYDAVELAQDDSFIRWVQGEEADARFWEQWLSEHPERAGVVQEARRLVQALHFEEEAPPPAQIEDLWSRIDTAIDEEQEENPAPRTARIRRLRRLGYVAAACAALLLIVSIWNRPSWQVVQTDAGQRLTHTFPDNSTVELNAATTLRYRPGDWGRERMVELDGEAFFEVEKGAPFTVEADQGSVRVLGTSFNVMARPAAFAVDCFTGRVGVDLKTGDAEAVLNPGFGARLTEQGDSLDTYRFQEKTTASWRRDTVYYDNEPLPLVFNRLERQFDVQVRFPESLEEKRATGYFRLVHVDSALYDVTWPLNLSYERQGRRVEIGE